MLTNVNKKSIASCLELASYSLAVNFARKLYSSCLTRIYNCLLKLFKYCFDEE